MDTNEARSILSEHLVRYRASSYEELAALASEGRIETLEAAAPTGNRYQIEVQFLWDGRPNGKVRVVGSIDDGGIRAFFPMTDAFVVGPEGRPVGE
jgi:hypothetical protein